SARQIRQASTLTILPPRAIDFRGFAGLCQAARSREAGRSCAAESEKRRQLIASNFFRQGSANCPEYDLLAPGETRIVEGGTSTDRLVTSAEQDRMVVSISWAPGDTK
ncbi:MAG TPA: hypothetical protein VG966_12775, partial [Hyphomicrobiaceae bacterium]|nr:hypothetical protein [Hyphomicrobiaceae bacterium]